jgi:type I restriction enzyme, S subunit
MTWTSTRVHRVANVNARIGWKALTASEYQPDGYVFLATPNIKPESIDFDNVNYISEYRYLESPELRLQPGDVLLAKDGNTLGITNIVRELPRPATVNGSIAVLRAFDVEPRFLRYSLASSTTRDLIDSIKGGMGVPHLFQWDIKRLPINLPPLDEQRRIADFLDAETARIDRLDELAFRTASLLTERRQTLIEQSVAHGNFSTRKLFPCLRLLRDGTHQPPPRTATGVPLLTARNVSSGTLQLTEHDTFVSPEDADVLEASLKPEHRDILLSVKGTVGATAIVPTEFPRVVLDRNLALLRPHSSLLNEWLVWVLRTRNLQDQMKLSIVAAAQPGLPLGAIRELRIPDVDITRQKERLQQIETVDEQISSLEAKIESQRKLLAERRQALITAAVTGQVDVSTAGRGALGEVLQHVRAVRAGTALHAPAGAAAAGRTGTDRPAAVLRGARAAADREDNDTERPSTGSDRRRQACGALVLVRAGRADGCLQGHG